MSATGEALVPRLEALVGAESVLAAGLARYAVDGHVPRIVVRPHDAEQVAAVLRVCAEAGAAVIPWGGGTAQEVGNPLRAASVVLRTDRLGRVLDHDAANLTVTVEAGITLEALGRALDAAGQWLPVEPPRAPLATPGGAASVDLGSPWRGRFGPVRDLVIGVRAALPDGGLVRWGGKTVKNVAGYDMAKLFVGAMGTLGVLTEMTFKVLPRPEVTRTVALWADLETLVRLAARIAASPLVPVAVTVLDRPAAALLGAEVGGVLGVSSPVLLVRADGIAPAVARAERDIGAWAAHAGGVQLEGLGPEAAQRVWTAVRDFGWSGDLVAARLSVPAGRLPGALAALRAGLPSPAGLVAHVVAGIVWAAGPASGFTPGTLDGLRRAAVDHQGHLLLTRLPAALKAAGDVWAPVPPALPVMRALKNAFDPQHILNPGRFVAGL
ncbi:MAG: FAD-binding oxidoreductase [Armatimonadota bacterium]|nr:FAD-binding oxidoreductase [Armatimonadota bacterium]MDR7487028.1 FAD-binding oxidoreductase [Armatimonadota bacterium]MDR7533631.1 FAD-binding oxidoreductase [Armatimonadota bacterium]MDR7537349.1 FAD-binding oxidoreductase [Armatimonadota bacterium]